MTPERRAVPRQRTGAYANPRPTDGRPLGTVLIAHPSAELYGSDRVALESARAFREAGWRVHVTLASRGPLIGLLEEAGCSISVQPVPVLRKAYLSPLGLLRFAALTARHTPAMIGTLRRLRPDVVYVSTLTVPWWLFLARLVDLVDLVELVWPAGRAGQARAGWGLAGWARKARWAGRAVKAGGARRAGGAAKAGPMLVICHVHEAEDGVPRLVGWGLTAPLLLAHRIVANSVASRDLLVSALPRLAGRTQVIYNGVPGPDADPSEPRELLGSPLRLVLVGRISPRKGTDVAVGALAALRRRRIEATLDLVGDVFAGYEWFADDVRRQVEAAGLGEAVHWHGVRSEVWPALAQADLALVPSRVEPFGNAAVEAMLAGRPVIAGDTQGLREIVRPGENGDLAAPGDAEALADAIVRAMDDWPAARGRARTAKIDANERFSPKRYRDRIAAAISDRKRA